MAWPGEMKAEDIRVGIHVVIKVGTDPDKPRRVLRGEVTSKTTTGNGMIMITLRGGIIQTIGPEVHVFPVTAAGPVGGRSRRRKQTRRRRVVRRLIRTRSTRLLR